MSEELKQIKKIYGEDMMHLCRESFPTILENEGSLLKILTDHIASTKELAKELKLHGYNDSFKEWIFSLLNLKTIKYIDTGKTPFQLMNEAGYDLYECHCESDIQSFKKYYEKDEVLCTIYNGNRLNRCYVFFAVKKNVDDIKREDFDNPQREDEYGTSVISIQFSRGECNSLSIKNRYNHTVVNPDATFSNNLENIIPGLTKSFENYYGLNIHQNDKRGNRKYDYFYDYLSYTLANDNRYYHYYLERNGKYYCDNNIIIEYGRVYTKYANKKRYLLMEDYVVDFQEKDIMLAGDEYNIDSFIQSIKGVGIIRKIEVTKNGDDKIIRFGYDYDKSVIVEISKYNYIIRYENNYVEVIGDDFLWLSPYLISISLDNLKRVYNRFLYHNPTILEISLPNLEDIGEDFLRFNESLNKISLPKARNIGEYFLENNNVLTSIYLPNAVNIGDCFLHKNTKLTSIFLKNAEYIGYSFLSYNKMLREIALPKVKTIGNFFLCQNKVLKNIYLPRVKEIGSGFLELNNKLQKVSLPEVRMIGDFFVERNKCIDYIEMPKVSKIGDFFLKNNESLKSIILNEVKTIGGGFLSSNEILDYIELSNVKTIGDLFLECNYGLESISFPNLELIGSGCLENNKIINSVYLPIIRIIGYNFLRCNIALEEISLPLLEEIGTNFLEDNKIIKKGYFPNLKHIYGNFLNSIIDKTSLEIPQKVYKL